MGTENSLLLSYFSVFALSKPKSYITPNFKKSNQNLMLPKYLNKNQSNQIEWKKEKTEAHWKIASRRKEKERLREKKDREIERQR